MRNADSFRGFNDAFSEHGRPGVMVRYQSNAAHLLEGAKLAAMGSPEKSAQCAHPWKPSQASLQDSSREYAKRTMAEELEVEP
eukprot:CAMPEP_0172668954 /NCGR_PEP_ID=MMETSP1074-20121228/9383_1 /TAXON_ID=2916 /ORGANISM="Ceratium fusus, Strain PA161109" /LENGTH=82 /DNA_ID=CAMNT_0013485673 /DNA_START=60 /DNA_END=309 /DNA_ORIENTATION=-